MWKIKRIPLEKIRSKHEEIEITTTDPSMAIPKSGKTKRKRSCKRKNKNIKAILGQTGGQDEQIFNEGDGLIDSEEENGVKDQPEATPCDFVL